MNWLDTLLDRGNEARRLEPPAQSVVPIADHTPTPRKPTPELKFVWVTVRQPSSNDDSGEVEPAFYSVADGVLTMRDEDGKATGERYHLKPDDEPQRVACRLKLKALQKTRSEFNRTLRYAPLGIA